MSCQFFLSMTRASGLNIDNISLYCFEFNRRETDYFNLIIGGIVATPEYTHSLDFLWRRRDIAGVGGEGAQEAFVICLSGL